MLEVAGRPMLRHVLDIYARHGVRDFVLAAGYLQHVIADYVASSVPGEWRVEVVDTGADTDTGERLVQCLDRVGETFFATYGDGVGDVDLAGLLRQHRATGAGVTVTVVPLPSPYGTLVVDEGHRVREFREKPRLADHPINAGFFAMQADDVRGVAGAGASLERDLLPALGADGKLFAYRHGGFWRSTDTHKDVLELDRLATEEGVPWLPRTTS
jgi:glucose-1-phosphate cytidylyltransferase